jgi:hypothetical protein
VQLENDNVKILQVAGPDKVFLTDVIIDSGPLFKFNIDAKTPVKDLLPTPPAAQPEVAPFLGDDLSQVPELAFQEPPAVTAVKFAPHPQHNETMKQMAHQIAKIKFLNQKETDGFLKMLLANRPDLAGLSFSMGDACRMKKEHLADFRLGLDVLHAAMHKADQFGSLQPNAVTAGLFWNAYQAEWTLRDKKTTIKHPFPQENINTAHLAGLVQVLMPESAVLRQGLAKYLSTIPHAEATRALARLAIFSPEPQVRQEAIKALKVRREKDYTDILLAGLSYPWPTVAQRAGEALTQLECTSVVPQLVNLLDEPDPRLPVTKNVNGKEVIQAKQMVRLNHHRNCLVCHSPAEGGTHVQKFANLEVNQTNAIPLPVTAPMPIPGQPMSDPGEGYGQSIPDILVRVDVTYLRQDFSIRQPVANAHPWPKMQRFDFLVRTVQLTPAQAKLFQEKLQPQAGAATPYQQVLVTTLRGLTGQDAGPTSAAWKKVLKS